ncbi:MAG: hypothetical protein OEM66_07150, partial [Acidimicrobiia bacterium]|nr:hypothetical protein [Acidimicrobiia bacterium]
MRTPAAEGGESASGRNRLPAENVESGSDTDPEQEVTGHRPTALFLMVLTLAACAAPLGETTTTTLQPLTTASSAAVAPGADRTAEDWIAAVEAGDVDLARSLLAPRSAAYAASVG